MKKQKILKFSAYTSGVITILMSLKFIFIHYIFPLFLKGFITNSEEEAIGIIGGADGPTVIFLADKSTGGVSLGGLIVIFAIITTILFLLSRYKKTNG